MSDNDNNEHDLVLARKSEGVQIEWAFCGQGVQTYYYGGNKYIVRHNS